jgi:hypothetical protein
MKSDQVEKIIMQLDGEELEGLVAVDEYVVEDDAVDIPGRNRTVPVRTGVKKIPAIGATFKISRNSATMQILSNFYHLKEFHDLVVIRTDGAGNEIRRELWPNCECSKFNGSGYDAASPVFSQIMTTFLPEDIIPIQI